MNSNAIEGFLGDTCQANRDTKRGNPSKLITCSKKNSNHLVKRFVSLNATEMPYLLPKLRDVVDRPFVQIMVALHLQTVFLVDQKEEFPHPSRGRVCTSPKLNIVSGGCISHVKGVSRYQCRWKLDFCGLGNECVERVFRWFQAVRVRSLKGLLDLLGEFEFGDRGNRKQMRRGSDITS